MATRKASAHTVSRSVHQWASRALTVVRRVIGVPDYDTYLAHVIAHHPDTVPMSQQAFIHKCWEDKYSRPGHRCC
jgi:uncharacterized short protein YbdD (DUF466 family)